MKVIYSNKRVEGLEGAYASPELFDGSTEDVKVCYTDDEKIAKAYEAKGIEVKAITEKKPVEVKKPTKK